MARKRSPRIAFTGEDDVLSIAQEASTRKPHKGRVIRVSEETYTALTAISETFRIPMGQAADVIIQQVALDAPLLGSYLKLL